VIDTSSLKFNVHLTLLRAFLVIPRLWFRDLKQVREHQTY